MRTLKYFKSVLIISICAVIFTTSNICADKATAQPIANNNTITVTSKITPLSIVNSPSSYLNKTVTLNARFDKFSTLGLDYKPAFKSSEEYISFVVKRDDTTFDIPLSELKLFLKRTEAEKFIELKSNDEIQITGTVFSDALGDAWIEVNSLIITKKAPEIKNGV